MINDEFLDLPKSNAGWNDVTDSNYSNKRKKSFKMFQHGGERLFHFFSAGEYAGTEYFHTVTENFDKPKESPEGVYSLMTKEQVRTFLNLDI